MPNSAVPSALTMIGVEKNTTAPGSIHDKKPKIIFTTIERRGLTIGPVASGLFIFAENLALAFREGFDITVPCHFGRFALVEFFQYDPAPVFGQQFSLLFVPDQLGDRGGQPIAL